MKFAFYLHGRKGRMGSALSSLIYQEDKFSISESIATADVAIDFSHPSSLKALLQECMHNRKPLVIGTTGYQETDVELMLQAAKDLPIFYASNFSFGMALLNEVVLMIAEKVDNQVGIEIIEAHHQHKKDRPSGSALTLARTIGRPNLPIHSIRVGDIVGDHQVIFGLEGERLELKHQAHSRLTFAKGALRAAQFLHSQPAGYYTMRNLLYAAC